MIELVEIGNRHSDFFRQEPPAKTCQMGIADRLSEDRAAFILVQSFPTVTCQRVVMSNPTLMPLNITVQPWIQFKVLADAGDACHEDERPDWQAVCIL